MNYRWNWSVLFQEPYLGWLLSGLRWTVLVTLCACSIGLIVGTVVGVARTVPSRAANALGTAYVELFRNVPGFDGRVFTVNKLSVGAIYDIPVHNQVKFGLGALVSTYGVPSEIKPFYGHDPVSYMLFARLKVQ